MIQINVPNDRLADFTDQLLGHRVGLHHTRRGFHWYPVNDIQPRGNEVALIFLGEDWDDEGGFEVVETVTRPLDTRSAFYLPEDLADQILEQLTRSRVGA